jgi:hypothetical protein
MADLGKASREKAVLHAVGVVAATVTWDAPAQDALAVIKDNMGAVDGRLREVTGQLLAARPRPDMPPVSGMDWALAVLDAQRMLAGFHHRAMGRALGGGA